MALSNIFREPRREITETAIGIAVFIPFAFLDYKINNYIGPAPSIPTQIIQLILIGLEMLLAIIGIFSLAKFIHFIGEEISDRLESLGIHLRPRQRY